MISFKNYLEETNLTAEQQFDLIEQMAILHEAIVENQKKLELSHVKDVQNNVRNIFYGP